MSESEYASFEELLKGDEIPEEDLILPGDRKIRVKGLSAFERKLTYKNVVTDEGTDLTTIETRIHKYGIVQPKMTEAQVEKWCKNALSGAVELVTNKIRVLSGMVDEADKSDL